MATLNLFPARIRFTNTDGTLTPEAYRALQVLFERVGGPLGDNGVDTFGDFTGVASLDMSLTDTVTQPNAPDIAHDSVSQSPSHERQALSDVMQAAAIDVLMPDVVQPLNEPVAFDLAAAVHAATSKATPVDADEIPLADSASGFTLKKLTWTNIKATLKTYFDTLYLAGSWASPGAIGVTAPNIGTFTEITGELVKTSSGTTAVTASGVAVTMLALPSVGAGTWLVCAAVGSTGSPAGYQAVAVISTSGAASRSTTIVSATNVSISVSGLNLQVTQTSGGAQAMPWSILRIS